MISAESAVTAGLPAARMGMLAHQHRFMNLVAQHDAQGEGADALVGLLVGGTVYELPAAMIDFVEFVPVITPLPNASRGLLGVGHSRGRTLAIIDLDQVMGVRTAADQAAHARLVALHGADVGLKAPLSPVAAGGQRQPLLQHLPAGFLGYFPGSA